MPERSQSCSPSVSLGWGLLEAPEVGELRQAGPELRGPHAAPLAPAPLLGPQPPSSLPTTHKQRELTMLGLLWVPRMVDPGPRDGHAGAAPGLQAWRVGRPSWLWAPWASAL